MNPSGKGWLNSYIRHLAKYADKHDIVSHLKNQCKDNNEEKKFYRLMQPTGIMYGHPLQTIVNSPINISRLDSNAKMKIVLADAFLSNSMLAKPVDIDSRNELVDFLEYSIENMVLFYKTYYPDIIVKHYSFWGRSKDICQIMEEILSKRIHVKGRWNKNVWAGFFHNSLLFLDIYYFTEYLKTQNIAANADDFYSKQEGIRLIILETIAAAAYANDIIELEEKQLFQFFLHSAHLSREKEKVAKSFIKEKPDVSEMDFSCIDSWMLRKYLLELAILTIWSDRNVDKSEHLFLKRLQAKLSLSDQEYNSSMLAIESFVISNWEQVHFLQKRHDLLIVKDQFSRRLSQSLYYNKRALAKEIQESQELVELLIKSTKYKLSEAEKAKVKSQLFDILKTLPTFVVIALPGTFITLPLLLKLLPKSAFPSAFNEDFFDQL